MALLCFVCNVQVGNTDENELNQVLSEYIKFSETLTDLLGDIVDKKFNSVKELHSNVICIKCYNTTMEYDKMKKRMQQLKHELKDEFKITLSNHGFNYITYPKKEPGKINRKIVLPASKLQPLPPNYVIDVNKIPRRLSSSSSPTINLKVTVGSTVLTQNIKTTQSSPLKLENGTPNDSVESNIANSLSSILGVKTSTSLTNLSPSSSMLTFNVNSVPKDFFSEKPEDVKKEVSEADDEEHNVEEECMEIDEGATETIIQEEQLEEEEIEEETTEKKYLDVSLLPVSEGGGDTILGKLQILDQDGEDDESEETIVMTGENGSILGIVSGQKLVYENGEITLADDDSNAGDENDDGHDSNDESQIELQVSGDEETANAIIAAAQEQGGAFIKVESGEMFRVKSVKSKHTTSTDDASPAPMHHNSTMVTVKDNLFQCLMCEKSNNETEAAGEKASVVLEAEAMMQHLRAAHGARLYLCQVCRHVMRRRAEYFRHLEQHSRAANYAPPEKKTHDCQICNKKYNSKTLLQEHMNVHNGTRPYSCAVCNKTFASKYTHQAHLKTHLERPRPFKCGQCGKSFLSAQNLSQHEKTHLGLKDFVCQVCNKAFSTQHNLEVHGVVHSGTKPFVCGVCSKAFARKAEIRDHMRIHTGERPFVCEICCASFTQRSNLLSHRRATHLNDKRYQCTQCSKKFKRRRLLDYHIKASHTGERPLECGICHATFVYPEHYKKHARIHSGERPYVCEVCGKSFNSRDNRNAHRFVHSDKKPYECVVCGAGYMRKQLLYAHMNTSGHLAESIVVNQPRVAGTRHNKSPQVTLNKIAESSQEEAEKQTINLVQETDDPALLTLIQALDNKTDSLQSITAEALGEQVQMVTTDENGGYRLVQLHLAAPTTALATWTLAPPP